jgi:hypothetical protein
LTDTAIRNARPGEKPVRLFDERGLYLEISPVGGKWWRLKYRFGGKEKRLSLGLYPDVSLKDARDRRDASRKLLADGIDPSEYRKTMKSARADKTANSFEIVAREWFAKYSSTWAANHSDRVIRRFERDIFPWIGARPIAEVMPPNCWLWCSESKTGAHWKPRTERWAPAGRCSATLWRPVGQCAIHAATCAARCPR